MMYVERTHIADEDYMVIVDLPSGEHLEITFDGTDPIVRLFGFDGKFVAFLDQS